MRWAQPRYRRDIEALPTASRVGRAIGQVLRRSTTSTDAAVRAWSALARDMLHTTTQGATP